MKAHFGYTVAWIKTTLKYWWLTPVVIVAVLVENNFAAREAMTYTLMAGFALQGLAQYTQMYQGHIEGEPLSQADSKSVYFHRLVACCTIGVLAGLTIAST